MILKDKSREIKFTLEVTHRIPEKSCDPNNPLHFKLNLNPDDKLFGLKETFSTKEDLVFVFNRIIEVINLIDERSKVYSEAVTINRDVLRKYGLSEEAINGAYDSNMKKPFEKIDRIVYKHNSPGEASISYGSNYNGDKRPTGKPKDDL